MNGIPPYSSYQSQTEAEVRSPSKRPQELPPAGGEKLSAPEVLPPPREDTNKK
jgi:hypothetical protein